MPLPANSAWFTLNLNGQRDFQVYSFTGNEAVSLPYSFTVEVVRAAPVEDLGAFIGVPALLSIADRSGRSRLVHGLVREMRRLRRGHHLTHYQCVLVPRLWFLGQNRDHRIFQHKSVPDIVTELLREQGFAAETFAFKCFYSYPQREYCVQYGESDLHFLSRLCEEEGIYYYFEHSENNHCLCFSDMPGGPRIEGESDLRYFPGSGQPADTAVIARIAIHSQSVSDQATCRDRSFLTPTTILEASALEPDFAKAPVAPGISYDVYRYPHLYQNQAEGERYAELQLLRQLTLRLRLEAESDVSRFTPGYTFAVHGHERDEVNAGWWATGVEHQGEQPQVLGREAPDRGMRYAARVEAVPERTRFVPERVHLKKRIVGDQTALVTGPAGEEIYPDEHGRVKVQFFWDREGRRNENTTCWIRVSQGWAGTGFGTMAIPRIGQEVVVSFLEGDPDRPLITGRMYNAGAMPPYELPAHKTRTVFKSMSTPGGDGPRGFNELTVEDKTGHEEIYLHAEKDVNVHVKNDWKEHILHDKHRTVDRHTYVRTEGETHETLQGVRKSELDANDSLTVHADSHTRVDGKWLRRVGGEVHLYAGNKAVLEAGTEATLQGGGSWIKLDPAGVTMSGPAVTLGGGGAEGGSSSAPLLPVHSLRTGSGHEPEFLLSPNSLSSQNNKKEVLPTKVLVPGHDNPDEESNLFEYYYVIDEEFYFSKTAKIIVEGSGPLHPAASFSIRGVIKIQPKHSTTLLVMADGYTAISNLAKKIDFWTKISISKNGFLIYEKGLFPSEHGYYKPVDSEWKVIGQNTFDLPIPKDMTPLFVKIKASYFGVFNEGINAPMEYLGMGPAIAEKEFIIYVKKRARK